MSMASTEADIVLSLLALVDLSLVAGLIVMVMFSGYENFVSKIDVEAEGREAGLAGQARCRHAEAEGGRFDRRDLFHPPAAQVHGSGGDR